MRSHLLGEPRGRKRARRVEVGPGRVRRDLIVRREAELEDTRRRLDRCRLERAGLGCWLFLESGEMDRLLDDAVWGDERARPKQRCSTPANRHSTPPDLSIFKIQVRPDFLSNDPGPSGRVVEGLGTVKVVVLALVLAAPAAAAAASQVDPTLPSPRPGRRRTTASSRKYRHRTLALRSTASGEEDGRVLRRVRGCRRSSSSFVLLGLVLAGNDSQQLDHVGHVNSDAPAAVSACVCTCSRRVQCRFSVQSALGSSRPRLLSIDCAPLHQLLRLQCTVLGTLGQRLALQPEPLSEQGVCLGLRRKGHLQQFRHPAAITSDTELAEPPSCTRSHECRHQHAALPTSFTSCVLAFSRYILNFCLT